MHVSTYTEARIYYVLLCTYMELNVALQEIFEKIDCDMVAAIESDIAT